MLWAYGDNIAGKDAQVHMGLNIWGKVGIRCPRKRLWEVVRKRKRGKRGRDGGVLYLISRDCVFPTFDYTFQKRN